MDIEANTQNHLRSFEGGISDQKRKVALGAGIGALVLGGIAVGVYFGVTASKSSSGSSASPANNPQTLAAFKAWQSTYAASANQPDTPTDYFQACVDNVLAQTENSIGVDKPQFTALLSPFCNYAPSQFASFKGKVGGDAYAKAIQALPTVETLGSINPPATLDWRNKINANGGYYAVSPVKNQGQCGDCWAFAAASTVESAFAIATQSSPKGVTSNTLAANSNDDQGNNVGVSPQQLCSCDTGSGNQGCNGGNSDVSIDQYLNTHALVSASTFPYTAGSGSAPGCKSGIPTYSSNNPPASTWDAIYVGSNAASAVGTCQYPNTCRWSQSLEQTVMAALTQGPLVIGVDASNWQNYNGGVMGASQCSTAGDTSSMDHAVQLVGYDSTANPPYWIVKNQWGTQWGENGYIRLQMGINSCCVLCGVIQVTLPAQPNAPAATTKPPVVITTKAPTATTTSPVSTTTKAGATTTKPGVTTTVPSTRKPITTFPPITQPPATNPPPATTQPPASGTGCSVSALESVTSYNYAAGCFTNNPNSADVAGYFYCSSNPDAKGLYACCYEGQAGSWGGSVGMSLRSINKCYSTITCKYTASAGSPSYPPLPSAGGSSNGGNSDSTTIPAACVSNDPSTGQLQGYWNGGICYKIDPTSYSVSQDYTQLSCMNAQDTFGSSC